MVRKIQLHKHPLNLVGAYVHAWGPVSLPPISLMARTEAALLPAVCCGVLLAGTVTQGVSLSGTGVDSTTFWRHSPTIGPKITFVAKGCMFPVHPTPVLLTLQTGSVSQLLVELKTHLAKGKKDPFSLSQQGDMSHPVMKWQEHMVGGSWHSPFH